MAFGDAAEYHVRNGLGRAVKLVEALAALDRDACVDTTIRLGQARGKLSTPELIGMMVRSKVDRLLAPR